MERRTTIVLDAMLERGESEEFVEPRDGSWPFSPAPAGIVERWRGVMHGHSGNHVWRRARIVTADHPETRELDAELRRVTQQIAEISAQSTR